jgi:hypothetical protein
MCQGAGKIIPEIGIEKESDEHVREGVPHHAPGDLHQEDNGGHPHEEIRGIGKGGAADELVHVPEGKDDGRDAQGSQEYVQPSSPGSRLLEGGVDQKDQRKDEAHVDHSKEIGFHGHDSAVKRPGHEGQEEEGNDGFQVSHGLSAGSIRRKYIRAAGLSQYKERVSSKQ